MLHVLLGVDCYHVWLLVVENDGVYFLVVCYCKGGKGASGIFHDGEDVVHLVSYGYSKVPVKFG